MKYRKLLQGALVLGGVALSSMAAATPSGSMLANTCAGCHGTHGNSHGPATPTIAGISSEYFIEAMKTYRDGSRPSTIMTRIAKGYNDDEIEAMASYFAEQSFVGQVQEHEAKLAKAGASLHDKFCEKCHAEGGSSADDDSGILMGQWKPYLHWTLEDFMSGKRDMPRKMKKQLEKVHKAYGDDGMAALLNYYASNK